MELGGVLVRVLVLVLVLGLSCHVWLLLAGSQSWLCPDLWALSPSSLSASLTHQLSQHLAILFLRMGDHRNRGDSYLCPHMPLSHGPWEASIRLNKGIVLASCDLPE